MDVLTWIIVVVVLLLVMVYGLTFAAKRQVDTVIMARPEDVVDAIEAGFSNGLLWRPVHGPGTWNFECRGIGVGSMAVKTKPVISIDASDHGPAGVLVQMWMSAYGSSYGQVGSADRVVFKRLKVIRRLKRLNVGTPSAQPPAGQQPTGGSPAAGFVTPPQQHGTQQPGGSGFGSGGPSGPAAGGRPTPTFGPGSTAPGNYPSQGGGFGAPPTSPHNPHGPQFGGGGYQR